MKKLLLGFFATVMFATTSFAQGVAKEIDLRKLTENSTIMFKKGGDIFDIKVGNTNSTILEPVFNSAAFNKLRVELYGADGKLLTSYVDEKGKTKGPNSDIDFTLGNGVPLASYVYTEQAEIWPLIAAIALCCVKASVGSNGWSVGFDCNCLSGKLANNTVDIKVNNKSFAVSTIQFVPLNSDGVPVPFEYKGWDVSLR